MTHTTLARPFALVAIAVLLAGCGSQAPVQLDVAPAATTGERAPAAEGTVTSEVTVTPGGTDRTEEPVTDAPRTDETDAVEAVTDAQEPAAGTAVRPATPAPDPELVVDEDGCATDVATGIVVACHDPAAGPDDDS